MTKLPSKPTSKTWKGNNEPRSVKEINSVQSLRRIFRTYASSISLAARSTEKLEINDKPSPEVELMKTKQELEEGVRNTLKMRQALREKSSLLEGKLRGNAKESDALHCMLRSTPCVGGRKRKFSLVIDGNK